MPRAARPNPPEVPAPVPDGPDPHMHRGKCTICKHPQRAEIERAFVDWCSPSEIAQMFGLKSRATIYRHARARGLHELRRRNLHFGLGRIAEQVAEVKPSAANVIAAFVAMAKINARGEWAPGHLFDQKRASDHAFWEEDWSAAREISLEDTIAGKAAPIHVQQENLRQFRAEYDARKAAEKLEAAKQAEQKAELACNSDKNLLPASDSAHSASARSLCSASLEFIPTSREGGTSSRKGTKARRAGPAATKTLFRLASAPIPSEKSGLEEAAQKKTALAEKPKAETEERLTHEPQPPKQSQPAAAAPSNPPPAPVQEKKQSEPEEERPQPIPQPPKAAASMIDTGPPQVAGLPWSWPRKKIFFARRGRRPVVP